MDTRKISVGKFRGIFLGLGVTLVVVLNIDGESSYGDEEGGRLWWVH